MSIIAPQNQKLFNIEQKFAKSFYIFFSITEAIIISAYLLVKYPESFYGLSDIYQTFSFDKEYYKYFDISINILIFVIVGFGFKYMYLKYLHLTSLCMIFVVATLSFQFYVLCSEIWEKIWVGTWKTATILTYKNLISEMKCSSAIIISLGALIVQIDHFQIIVVCLIEALIFSANEAIIFRQFGMRDSGGASYIHIFGAYFGVSASILYSKSKNHFSSLQYSSSTSSGVLSFLGALFIWIFFPSFNSVNPNHLYQAKITYNNMFLSIINTYYSLIASTITSFIFTLILNRGKINYIHILNASISGGTIIAACSDMLTLPFIALLLGSISSVLSILFYEFGGALLRKCNISDTMNILSFHGINGILSVIASMITLKYFPVNTFEDGITIYNDFYVYDRSVSAQIKYQAFGGLCSLGCGILGGLLSGLLLKLWKHNISENEFFIDYAFFVLDMDSFNNLPEPQREIIKINSNEGLIFESKRIVSLK